MRKLFFVTLIISSLMVVSNLALAQEDIVKTQTIKQIIAEAKAGSSSAAYSLAQIHIENENYTKAEEWLRFSIYKGEGKASLALYELAKAGHVKLENPEDIKKIGLLRIREDAEAGSGAAAINLADMYLKGEYFDKDYEQAQKWYYVADEDGKPRASYMLGLSYMNGLYNNSSIRKAMRYFEKASNGGIAMASRQLGIAYASGVGKEKDLEKAQLYFKKAAVQGNALIMRDLALTYKELGNTTEYINWLKKAAADGDADSNYYLGKYYSKTDVNLSKKYFNLAVKQKHHLARVQVDETY